MASDRHALLRYIEELRPVPETTEVVARGGDRCYIRLDNGEHAVGELVAVKMSEDARGLMTDAPTLKTGKHLLVRTHPDEGEPTRWLHALDPLEPGRASFVRSEWRDSIEEATVFPSRGYAEDVANAGFKAKGGFRYKVIPVPW